MTEDDFSEVFEAQVIQCRNTLVSKAREYATFDRLHNFKVAGKLQSMSPKEALGGMLAKHVVSIYDMLPYEDESMDKWDEKIGDALNYLFLLKAMVVEEQRERDEQLEG
jgi:hypothetical protein